MLKQIQSQIGSSYWPSLQNRVAWKCSSWPIKISGLENFCGQSIEIGNRFAIMKPRRGYSENGWKAFFGIGVDKC